MSGFIAKVLADALLREVEPAEPPPFRLVTVVGGLQPGLDGIADLLAIA